MPNWCTNKLTVMGSYDEVRAFRNKAKGHSPWPRQREMEQEEAKPNLLNFHNFVPVPQEVLAAGYNMAGHLWKWRTGAASGAHTKLVLSRSGMAWSFTNSIRPGHPRLNSWKKRPGSSRP